MWHFPSARPLPRPGAWLTLAECTLAPRSLSQSKLLVPNTKLLPLAKEGKIKERMLGVRGEIELKGKSTPPPATPTPGRHFRHWEQSGSGKWADQNVYLKFFYAVSHFCSTEQENIRASHQDHGHFWASDILKQEPWHFIPNASPLARMTHLLWNQDTCVAPPQPLPLTLTGLCRSPGLGAVFKHKDHFRCENIFKWPPSLQAPISGCLQNTRRRRCEKLKMWCMPGTRVLVCWPQDIWQTSSGPNNRPKHIRVKRTKGSPYGA